MKLILALFLGLLFGGRLYAEIGQIHLDLLITFHPKMLLYDLGSKRFTYPTRGVKEKGIHSAFDSETQQKQAELEKKLKGLEANILAAREKLSAAIFTLQGEYNRKMLKMDARERTATRAKMNQEIARAEQRENETLFGLLVEKGRTEKELEALKIRLSYGDKMSQYECRLYAREIVEEIIQTAVGVGRNFGITTIVDSSALYPFLESYSREAVAGPDAPNYFLKMLEKREGADQLPRDDPGTLVGDQANLQANATQWFQSRKFFMEHFLECRGGRFVLAGGRDLTEAVLMKILENNRIPAARAKQVLEAVREMR